MAAQEKKKSDKAGRNKNSGNNKKRLTTRTDLQRKLVKVYKSCGRKAGHDYLLRCMEIAPTMATTFQKIARKCEAKDDAKVIQKLSK